MVHGALSTLKQTGGMMKKSQFLNGRKDLSTFSRFNDELIRAIPFDKLVLY
jgi:hypothetical protein